MQFGNKNITWQDFENIYCNIFIKALFKLNITVNQKDEEDNISESLLPIFNEICYNDENEISVPQWRLPIMPVNDNEKKGGKKNKEPDFTCSMRNNNPKNPDYNYLNFHVECKRLGKTDGSPELNILYINNGIKRFLTKEHEYGKRVHSGVMIGYIINMEKTDISKDVNRHLHKNKLPILNFEFTDKVVSCDQRLTRTEVEPSDFKLIHIWVDLRN